MRVFLWQHVVESYSRVMQMFPSPNDDPPHLPSLPRSQTGSQKRTHRLLGFFPLLFPPYRVLVLSLCSLTGSDRSASGPPPGPDCGSACSLQPSLRANFQTNFQMSKVAVVSAVFALGAPAGRLRLDLQPRHFIFVIVPPRFMVRSSETPPCAENTAICISLKPTKGMHG